MILTGTNTYSGGTTISAGTLQVGAGGTAGTLGSGNIVNNGNLVFNRSDSVTVAGSISGTGNVSYLGVGTLTLGATNTYTGTTAVNSGGTLSVGAGSLGGTSNLAIGTIATSSLNFFADGVGAAVNLAPGANVVLGGATSRALLGFQLGSLTAYDSLNLSGTGVLTVGAGGVGISIVPLTGFNTGTYTLISSAQPFAGAGTFSLSAGGTPAGFGYILGTTGNSVTLQVINPAGVGNVYWNGGGGANISWNAGSPSFVGGNFSSDTAGTMPLNAPPGASNTVNFSGSNLGTTAVSSTLDQNFSVLGINVLGTSGGVVTINQGTFGSLGLGTDGISLLAVTSGTGGATTINAPIILNAAQTWAVDPSRSLSVLGTNAANGVISGTSPTFGINKTGSGALTLGGFNTFGGGVTLSSGTLNINNGGSSSANSALGTGQFTIVGGTTIDNTSGNAQVILTNNTQAWNGDFTFTGTNALSMGTGAITMSGSRVITVTGGTLLEGGAISGGAFSLTKAGTGALSLSGAAGTWTGGVVLQNGILNVNSATALGTGVLTINNTGSGVTLDNTSAAAVTVTNAQSWGSDFAFRGSNQLIMSGPVTTTSSRTLAINGLTNVGGGVVGALTISGPISDAADGSPVTITKNGTGTLQLSGTSTFSGGVILNNGTLNINSAGGAGSGPITINGGIVDTSAAITLLNSNSWALNADLVFGGGNNLNTGVGTVTMNGTRTAVVLNNTLTVGGMLTGTAGAGLSKLGNGTMTLAGPVAYTGATAIKAGTLTFNTQVGGALGTSSITFTGTSTLNFDNTGAGFAISESIPGALTFTSGEGTVQIVRNVALNDTATFGSLGARTAGAVGTFSAATNNPVLGTSAFITLTGQANGFMGPGYFAVQNGTTAASTFAWYDTTLNSVRTIVYGTDAGTFTVGAGTGYRRAMRRRISCRPPARFPRRTRRSPLCRSGGTTILPSTSVRRSPWAAPAWAPSSRPGGRRPPSAEAPASRLAGRATN